MNRQAFGSNKVDLFVQQIFQVGLVHKKFHSDWFRMVKLNQYVNITFSPAFIASHRAKKVCLLHWYARKVVLKYQSIFH